MACRRALLQAPSSVSIVTADDIKKYGYRTLAAILESVRGLYVTYDRNYSFLGIRGFNRGDFNSRILLLIDGHQIPCQLSPCALSGHMFPALPQFADALGVRCGGVCVLST